jgi:deoxyribonuclease (pyrimidine dimer)
MTRVNANIPPKELKRAHLLAELREITMVPAALKRSRKTRTDQAILADIPKEFCLNKNHVKFFYDKQQFLIDRFNALCEEMERRGYTPSHTREAAFYGLPKPFYGTWSATEADNDIVRERIALRISQKPHLYKD